LLWPHIYITVVDWSIQSLISPAKGLFFFVFKSVSIRVSFSAGQEGWQGPSEGRGTCWKKEKSGNEKSFVFFERQPFFGIACFCSHSPSFPHLPSSHYHCRPSTPFLSSSLDNADAWSLFSLLF
jgi:hypothetical protein